MLNNKILQLYCIFKYKINIKYPCCLCMFTTRIEFTVVGHVSLAQGLELWEEGQHVPYRGRKQKKKHTCVHVVLSQLAF